MEKKDAYRKKGKGRMLSVVIVLIACFLYIESVTPVVGLTIPEPAEQTHIFYPIEDTYIDHTAPDRNFTNASVLQISNAYGNNSSGWEQDIIIYFNVVSLPSYIKVTTATLYLYYYDYDMSDPFNRVLSIHQITAAGWNINNVTWNTRPTIAQNNVSYTRVPAALGWMTWDVTTEVQRIVNNPTANQGWQIADKNPWRQTDIPIIKFKSKETQTMYLPYLEVHYTIPFIVSTNGPYGGYINEAIAFNGTVIDGGTPPYTWYWDFGDGTSSPQNNVSHVYTTAGSYTVILTAYDSNGLSATATTTATIRKNITEPWILIQHPKNGLYFRNKKIIPLRNQWIIGYTDIIIETDSNNPIVKVKFFVDNELKQVDTTEPYLWTLNRSICRGKHTIKVIAVDSLEASAVDQITVYKIL